MSFPSDAVMATLLIIIGAALGVLVPTSVAR
jgi:hypothetical protein